MPTISLQSPRKGTKQMNLKATGPFHCPRLKEAGKGMVNNKVYLWLENRQSLENTQTRFRKDCRTEDN
uniref:Uncharacterized protein n=1 Tax=Arion vulgaris TaxID=1028688 RepID=A0A0B7BNN0_9EUPU